MPRVNPKITNAGFSLLELIISISVLSILIGIALPYFNSFIAQRRVSNIQQTLIDTLSLARNEALTRGEEVSICGVVSRQLNCPIIPLTGAVNWSAGWNVSVVSSGELVRDKDQIHSNISINYSNGSEVTFGPLGELNSSTNTEQYFVIADVHSGITAALSVRTTGSVRTCRDWNTDLNTCDDS